MASVRRSAAEASHDGREELAHLVGSSAGHGVAGFVADLVQMVAHVLDGQFGTVEALCPAYEEPRNMACPNGIDFPRHRTLPVGQVSRHGGHQGGIQSL